MSKHLRVFVFFYFLITSIFAEPIIVTAEQFERPYAQSTSSIELITREQIEQSGADSVIGLLKSRVGLSIPTNGPFGKASSIQIRGADARHTLILIDGIRATDVTSISGGARLEFLGIDQIESIEILRGSQSVLYGSEAIGGVLKITTIKPERKSAQLKLGYGSYNNRMGSGSFRGEKKIGGLNLKYLLGAGIQRVDGFSAFNEKRSQGADEDGLNQTQYLGKLYLDKGNHSFSFGIQGTQSNYEIDDATGDNPNSDGRYKDYQLFVRHLYHQSDELNVEVNYTQKNIDRNLEGISSSGAFRFVYSGKFRRLELKNRMELISGGETILGLEAERESVDALDSPLSRVRRRSRVAGYLNHYQKWSKLIAEGGIRVERFQSFDEQAVFKSSLGYLVDSLTYKGSFSTGFKAPSLYQSFNTFSSSSNLTYESSKSSELGILYSKNSTMLEFTVFQISYDNFIDFDSPSNRYVNRGDFVQRGLELSSEAQIDQWELNSSYTFLRSKNELTGVSLVRRPKHKASANLVYNLLEGHSLSSQLDFVGRRPEINNQELPSYWTFGMTAMARLGQYNLKISLNNIMNREYEEVLNFPARGRNFLISLSGNWY